MRATGVPVAVLTALSLAAIGAYAPAAPAETGETGSTGPTEVATELSLSASNYNTREGELETYTATISPEPSSGGVEFREDGIPIPQCVAVPVENGVAECKEALVEHEGNVTIEARYTDELPNQLTAEWGESHNEIVIEAGISYIHELEDEELERAEEARIEREAREDAERQEYEEREHAREQTEREHEEHETTTELTASPTEPFSGHAIVYTAIVQAKNGETVNSGVVTFTVEGTRIEECVAVPVNSSGEAVCETPDAPGGHYSGARQYPYHAHAEYSDQEEPFGYSEGEVEVNVREPTTPTVSERIRTAVLAGARRRQLARCGRSLTHGP